MPYLVVLDLATCSYFRNLHPHSFVLLSPTLLKVSLLNYFLSLVRAGTDKVAEDLIGGLEGIIDSLVIDANGGIEELRGELPKTKVSVFGKLRVDDFDWYLEGIS